MQHQNALNYFRDRFRTAVNVWGDSVGAGVVEAMSKSQLKKLDYTDPETEDLPGKTNGMMHHKPEEEKQNGIANAAFTEEGSRL